ncbi:hypothetical protein NPIL_263001, partial [Nephila pilipes]
GLRKAFSGYWRIPEKRAAGYSSGPGVKSQNNTDKSLEEMIVRSRDEHTQSGGLIDGTGGQCQINSFVNYSKASQPGIVGTIENV